MKAKIPDSPGVYFFLNKKREITYIGKATSLRNRVKSYFSGNILDRRSPLIGKMVKETKDVKFQKTDSVLEALILEADLIKKHLPPYNTAEKDQKSWNFVVITKEEFSRILVMRERELFSPDLPPLHKGSKYKFGPFTNGEELKVALKIIRKIFPFRDKCKLNQERGCFNHQIGLCPGVCIGAISKKEYAGIIRNIKLIFEGKKLALIKSLEHEMRLHAKLRNFEIANEIKHKIFTLQHIQDIALLKTQSRVVNRKAQVFKMEAYDVAHISGTSMVGVMVVIKDGEPQKSDYRKFKIKIQKNDDLAALREVLERRLRHIEWPFPDLIVVDGGAAQINTAKAALEKNGLNIPVVAVVKDEKHKACEILGNYPLEIKNLILFANSEAHRFAIAYHRKIRSFIVR